MPVVISVITGPFPSFDNTAEPSPVTVQVALGGLCVPRARGKRNCFADAQRWLEAPTYTYFAKPPSTSIAPKLIDSPMVEQAPNKPK